MARKKRDSIGRTKSAGDSKQQSGGVRGSRKSNLKRNTTIGPNERAAAKKSLEKEKAGGKLGPNERASLKKYKDTLPKATPKPESKEKKKEALKPTKGKGPVASGEEYGKHLKEQQKKYKTTGKGPVKDSKEYGKTVKEHAAKKEADAAAKKKSDMEAWIKKTRNSPAQRSGAWKGKEHELYAQHLRHKAWKESRKKKNKK